MCYAYKPVYGLDGKLYKVPHREFEELTRDGRIIPSSDGYHYAQDNVITILKESEKYVLKVMRWDLVPRFYLQNQNLTVSEMIKKKELPRNQSRHRKVLGF